MSGRGKEPPNLISSIERSTLFHIKVYNTQIFNISMREITKSLNKNLMRSNHVGKEQTSSGALAPPQAPIFEQEGRASREVKAEMHVPAFWRSTEGLALGGRQAGV